MSIEDLAPMFPEMERIEYPCGRCGAPVVLLSQGDPTLLAKSWADGTTRVFCGPCGLLEILPTEAPQ